MAAKSSNHVWKGFTTVDPGQSREIAVLYVSSCPPIPSPTTLQCIVLFADRSNTMTVVTSTLSLILTQSPPIPSNASLFRFPMSAFDSFTIWCLCSFWPFLCRDSYSRDKCWASKREPTSWGYRLRDGQRISTNTVPKYTMSLIYVRSLRQNISLFQL